MVESPLKRRRLQRQLGLQAPGLLLLRCCGSVQTEGEARPRKVVPRRHPRPTWRPQSQAELGLWTKKEPRSCSQPNSQAARSWARGSCCCPCSVMLTAGLEASASVSIHLISEETEPQGDRVTHAEVLPAGQTGLVWTERCQACVLHRPCCRQRDGGRGQGSLAGCRWSQLPGAKIAQAAALAHLCTPLSKSSAINPVS